MSNISRYIQLGPIFDISSHGMSIHYFYNNDFPDVSSDLAISTLSGKIIIDDIRFETVYDVEIAAMPDGKKIRKRVVKLVGLSGYQSAWLACLIVILKACRKSQKQPIDSKDIAIDDKTIMFCFFAWMDKLLTMSHNSFIQNYYENK